MKTLHKKFLITKDQYEDKASRETKMQGLPYHEEEYWKKKESRPNRQGSRITRSELIKLLSEIKGNKNKPDT